jgi:uncharacterized protein YneF (UPF0154 family)
MSGTDVAIIVIGCFVAVVYVGGFFIGRMNSSTQGSS